MSKKEPGKVNRHLAEEELVALAELQLPVQVRRRLQDHVDGCEQCDKRLTDMRALPDGFSAVLWQKRKSAFAKRVDSELARRSVSAPRSRRTS